MVQRKRSGESQDRRKLSPEYEALARGDRPPRRKQTPKLMDPRPNGLIPGVSNRDARLLFELRVERMKQAKGEKLGHELAEANLLSIWRGGALTGMDALIQDVLEMDKAEGHELMQKAVEAAGWEDVYLNEEVTAVFLRAESALFDAGLEGKISPSPTGIQFNFDTAHAAAALHAIGTRVRALVEDHLPQEGDKKFSGDKGRGDKKFSDKGRGDKKFGDKKFGDKKFGDKKFGDKKFGDKKFAGKSDKKRFGDKPRDKFARGGKKPGGRTGGSNRD